MGHKLKEYFTPVKVYILLGMIFMVMLMVMIINGLVMITSYMNNGYDSTSNTYDPSEAPEVMVIVPTPETVMVYEPTSTPIPYDYMRNSTITSLARFNKVHNHYAEFMSEVHRFHTYEMISLPAMVYVMLSGLTVYEDGIELWRPEDFTEDWIDNTKQLHQMKEAELNKIKNFRILMERIRQGFDEQNQDKVDTALKEMSDFNNTDITMSPARIQYVLLHQLNIDPSLVNFKYDESIFNGINPTEPLTLRQH